MDAQYFSGLMLCAINFKCLTLTSFWIALKSLCVLVFGCLSSESQVSGLRWVLWKPRESPEAATGAQQDPKCSHVSFGRYCFQILYHACTQPPISIPYSLQCITWYSTWYSVRPSTIWLCFILHTSFCNFVPFFLVFFGSIWLFWFFAPC